MKFGKKPEQLESKVNMTPMIDIVFQLLVFFIMTFKVVAMEGDFKVKMPLATTNPVDQMMEVFPTIVNVRIAAGDEGGVAQVEVDTGGANLQTFTDNWPAGLTDYVSKVVAAEGDPSTADEIEVEFDIDFSLKYGYTVLAIESVSGEIQPDGSVRKLIEKIKFKNRDSG